MKSPARNLGQASGTTGGRAGRATGLLVMAMLLGSPVSAEGARADPSDALGGGAMARVLPPAEKIKVLEDELARESDRRAKAEEESARRRGDNEALVASGKNAARERAALEARLSDTRDREAQLQKANESLREENQRIAMAVRLALPIVTLACIAILVLLIWTILFLRKIALRVHDQHTLAEMHELEARVIHATDQHNAELKRNQTLRSKLAELGIVDEEAPHTPSVQRRTR